MTCSIIFSYIWLALNPTFQLLSLLCKYNSREKEAFCPLVPGGYAEHQHGHVPEDQAVFWKSAHRFHNPSVFCRMQLFKATKFTSETLYSSCLCWYFWWGSILSIFHYISTLPLIAFFHQIYILSLPAVHTQTFLLLGNLPVTPYYNRGTKMAEQLRVKMKLYIYTTWPMNNWTIK